MAKFIAQIIVAGSQVIGRAFARALKQEYEASQQAAQRLGNAKTRTERMANQKLGLSLDEAKQILNIGNEATREEIQARYDALFKANDKGGSFYLQSKVVRAKERIDAEFGAEQGTKTAKEGPGDGEKT